MAEPRLEKRQGKWVLVHAHDCYECDGTGWMARGPLQPSTSTQPVPSHS